MKNPYPESLPTHRYQDGGQPLATKWQTHPVTGVTTVTVLTDRAYILIEPHPGWAVELGLHEPLPAKAERTTIEDRHKNIGVNPES